MLNGLLDLSLWGYIGSTLLFTHITIAAVTIFLHRHQAHRSLELHPLVSHFFRLWLWLSTGMKTKEWVAIHRKHHANCETPDDPHSPQVLGLGKVLWQGAELYRAEAARAETIERYGKRTPDDWLEHHLYSRVNLGIGLMLLIDLLLFGIAGIAIWAIQMIWIPFWAAGVVNGIGHYWGYRNYECKDAATNILPWGILIGGEELHNNHHTFASSAKLSSKWWEFDIGWMYIRLLQSVGLAKVNRVAPKPSFDTDKSALDLDTMTALMKNRFQVMASYYRKVVKPVSRKEWKQSNAEHRKLYRRARSFLRREESLLAENEQRELESALQQSKLLQEVYRFKQQLQSLWQNNINQEGLQKLQEWCRQAEASGIESLEQFAQSLRLYTRKTA